MSEKSDKNQFIRQEFTIHYYFNDDSHSMDAFVRNQAESNILSIINKVSKSLDIELILETEAYQEGGLKEVIFYTALVVFAPSLNDLLFYYTTEKWDIDKQKLKNLVLDEEIKQLDIQIKQETLAKLQDEKIERETSKFYKKLKSYQKVTQVGFQGSEDKNETIVERKDFDNFIVTDNKYIKIDDNASIEIISPVLKGGNYKWRGIYQNEKIDFSMGDNNFKENVIQGKYTFSSESKMEAKLQITTTYDDFENEVSKSYSVKEVFEFKEDKTSKPIITKKGQKKKIDDRQQEFNFD